MERASIPRHAAGVQRALREAGEGFEPLTLALQVPEDVPFAVAYGMPSVF
jgi:hypothetical protein